MEAIIYRRYSNREQGSGSSLSRQSSICEAYCERKGWPVIDVVSDEGISAWSGANIETGNLSKLTERIESDGKGKVIVVEQLDRITRQPPDRIILWLSRINRAGASLATANDDNVIDADSFSQNPLSTMGLVFNAYRAFSESQHKSERLSAAWEKKRKAGNAMTGRCVAWLKLIDGQFVVIEERADVVRRIFALALAGYGPTRIARLLNEEGVNTFGRSKGWHISYIKKILSNRAVIGELQPHTRPRSGQRMPAGDPISDYYPAIVSERDFALVKAQRPTVRQSASRGFANLLSGLCECRLCGGKVIYLNRGTERLADGTSVRREYLQCEQSRRGLCDGKLTYPYQSTLDDILDRVLAAALMGVAEPRAKAESLENEVLKLERLAADADARAERLLKIVEEGDDIAGERYRTVRAESRSYKSAAKSARTRLLAENATPSSADMAARAQKLRGDLSADEDARRATKMALDRFVQRVEFDPVTGQFEIDCSPEILLHFGVELSAFWRRAAEGYRQ